MIQSIYDKYAGYERGKAQVTFERGLILTERPPAPVIFNQDFFATISTGQDVLFRRDPTNAQWANDVVAVGSPRYW